MKPHEALAQSVRQLSNMHQSPSHGRRESQPKVNIDSMLAYGVNRSSLIRPDSLTICSGLVTISGRVRMCLVLYWKCRTMHSVLISKLVYGDEQWHWWMAR